MCVAVAFIALVYASHGWATLAFTLSIFLLLASLVLSYTDSAQRRPLWIGFAVFGWGYWAVLHSPILDMESDSVNWRLEASGPPLVTSSLLEWTYVINLASKNRVVRMNQAVFASVARAFQNKSAKLRRNIRCHSLVNVRAFALANRMICSSCIKCSSSDDSSADNPVVFSRRIRSATYSFVAFDGVKFTTASDVEPAAMKSTNSL